MANLNVNSDTQQIPNYSSEKPVVAFMPLIYSLGETIPLIEIARKYEEFGGKAIFIGDEGGYTHIIKDYGFKYITIKTDISESFKYSHQKKLNDYNYKQKNLEDIAFDHFPKDLEKTNMKMIEDEAKIFKKENVKLVVTGFKMVSKISARKANLPILFIISGVATPQYFKSKFATFPENYENIITRFVPMKIKNRLTNLYALKSKMNIKGYNKLARKYDVPQVKYFYNLFHGDYTLVADDINFLKLKPSKESPSENYVGPIIANNFNISDSDIITKKIEKHLSGPSKSILVTMGSSTAKKLIFDIINILNNSKYNAVVVYSKKLIKNDKKPKFNENVLFFETVPSIRELNEKVDLAIIHGGRGTVYTAAYSGKPAIGYPMQVEQQYNLDLLVRHRSALRLSKKNFSEKQLVTAINKIFDNYAEYLNNAHKLKEELQLPNGAENAAKIIFNIVTSKKIKNVGDKI